MGQAIDARLAELIANLPVGIELRRVHWQSAVVDEAHRRPIRAALPQMRRAKLSGSP